MPRIDGFSPGGSMPARLDRGTSITAIGSNPVDRTRWIELVGSMTLDRRI
jgi:hypothetical protein